MLEVNPSFTVVKPDLFLFPKEVMQLLNKGFRVLYATMAPASRTTNQIDPVVLHGSLESTIS